MALIVEDGTGKSDANSYISVDEANSYHSGRGNTLWETLSTTEKEQAIVRSVDYMIQVYRLKWDGTRNTTVQALDFPRSFVEIKDHQYQTVNGYAIIGGNTFYPNDEVPQEVKNACAELAFKAASGELAEDLTQGVIREKVDVLEVEYDKNSPQYKRYRAIDNLLAPFFKRGSYGAFRDVRRV